MTKDDADGGVRAFYSSLSSPSRSGVRQLFGISLGRGRKKDVRVHLVVLLGGKREREMGGKGRDIPFFAILSVGRPTPEVAGVLES